MRPTRKNLSIIIAATTASVCAVLAALLAWGPGPPRLDATTAESLKTSMQAMTARMTDDQKSEFLADCMAVALSEMKKAAFQRAFFTDKPLATNNTHMFEPLQGKSASEIHAKAEEARRASQEAPSSPAASRSDQPLPGVPEPVEALKQPIEAQPNAGSPPERETGDTEKGLQSTP